MQQNTVEQLVHFPSVLWNLPSFVSLWLKNCRIIVRYSPMLVAEQPETITAGV